MYLELAVHDRHMDKEKSKSTEFLNKCQSSHLDTCTVLSARAHSTWDLSSGENCDKLMKFDENMFSRTRSSKRCKVIPHSVKYAVSPSQKVDHSTVGGIDTKPSSSKLCSTDVLDQTLNSIRAKLNMLQIERFEMENRMTYIMEDIRSALIQARHTSIHKGHRVFVKSKSSDGGSMNKLDSQIFFPAHDTDQSMITVTRELTPTEIPASFFNRRGSVRQKLTSIMLSPTQFIRQVSISKPSTLPHTYSSADSVCKVSSAKKTFLNSGPECAIIGTILEDSNEAINPHATQHKSYNKTEERSSNSKSTFVRRSSLTGQLEHYKLPAQSMEDSKVKMRDRSDKVHAIERRRKATSMFTHNITTASRHISPQKYSVHAIFLPSTETTV